MDIQVYYDPDRKAWELIYRGEWYAEGTYEEIDEIRRRLEWDE
jgi:hypothetical protein